MAAIASTAQISAASSLLNATREPNWLEPDRSTTKKTVCSRSSRKRLTCGAPARAVTFQSIERISSPGMYGRTSSNSIPWPLNTLWYSPAMRSLTSRFETISIRRTFFWSVAMSNSCIISFVHSVMQKKYIFSQRHREAKITERNSYFPFLDRGRVETAFLVFDWMEYFIQDIRAVFQFSIHHSDDPVLDFSHSKVDDETEFQAGDF